MTIAGAVQSVLRQYATFRGRAARSEFWWWYLCTVLVNLTTTAIDKITDATFGVSFVGPLVGLGLLVPTLAVSVRRLHDSGLSGWWLLAPIGLAIGGVVLLVGGLASIVAAAFVSNGPEASPLTIGLIAAGALVLLASVIVNLVLMLRRSTAGPNRYGPFPGAPAGYPPTGSYGYWPSPYGPPPPGAPGDSTPPRPGPGGQPGGHGPW